MDDRRIESDFYAKELGHIICGYINTSYAYWNAKSDMEREAFGPPMFDKNLTYKLLGILREINEKKTSNGAVHVP